MELLSAISYVLVGITGAVFANSTGAGGGVVFVPLFHQLGFTAAVAVATSFGIQSFGMTSGAIAWSRFARQQPADSPWKMLWPMVLLSVPFSVAGLWTVYLLDITPPAETLLSFSVFSLLLGIAILITSWRRNDASPPSMLRRADVPAVIAIAYLGGIVTAWLSVGVGEFLAFYMILRRYDATVAVAAAVIITAISVWSVFIEHAFLTPEISWAVVIFAGPGAVVGAVLARMLAVHLGALRLKRFFGAWLIIIGLSELATRAL